MTVTLYEIHDGAEHEDPDKKSPHVLVTPDGERYPIVEPRVGIPFTDKTPIFVKVSVDGKKAQLSDLAQGMECELELGKDGFVTDIAATTK